MFPGLAACPEEILAALDSIRGVLVLFCPVTVQLDRHHAHRVPASRWPCMGGCDVGCFGASLPLECSGPL